MKFLKSLFLSLAFISQVSVYASYAPYVVREVPIASIPKPQNRSGHVKIVQNDYSALIEKYALKFDISPTLTASIIYCESRNNRYALNDNPDVEFSVGLSQINLLAHTNVTREQAEDPEFAISFLAENIAKGKAPSMWYNCYKKATQ